MQWEKDKELPSPSSLSEWPRPGQAEAEGKELNPGLPHGCDLA